MQLNGITDISGNRGLLLFTRVTQFPSNKRVFPLNNHKLLFLIVLLTCQSFVFIFL